MTHEIVKLAMSERQLRNLFKHRSVQIPHHHIHHPEGWPVVLKHAKARKLHTAHRNGRGARVHLDDEEVKHTIQHGGGIFDGFLNKLKDFGNTIKSKIIDTPFYQQSVRPIVHDIVQSTVKPFAQKYAGPLGGVAGDAIDKVGSATGAFGLKRRRRVKSPRRHHARVAYAHGAHSVGGFTAPDYVPSLPHGGLESEMGGRVHRRRSPARGGRLVKGSAEAREMMARLRSMKKRQHGGSFLRA